MFTGDNLFSGVQKPGPFAAGAKRSGPEGPPIEAMDETPTGNHAITRYFFGGCAPFSCFFIAERTAIPVHA